MTSPTLGAGASPAGSSGAGIGLPAVGEPHVRALLLTSSGAQGSAPRIDPTTLDLELDASGNVVGADSVDQSVQLILMTRKGSTMDPEFGLRELPKLMLPNINAICRAYVSEALARLISKKLIELVLVEVKKQGSQFLLTVKYRNLSSAENNSVSLPL